MLVVERNSRMFEWNASVDVKPLSYTGDLVIAIDPSKTNMAVVFGTPDGTVINVLEFSGNNRKKGPVMDTTMYCAQFRQYMRAYLRHANIYCAAVEQAIMKKGVHQSYHSNMVLTEIRSNILNFFLEDFGIQVIEVNNWSWKSHCLPQGYRSPFEKGSKRYFIEQHPEEEYGYYFEADVTDCICIYRYIIDTKCAGYTLMCNRSEPKLHEYRYLYTNAGSNPDFDDSYPTAVYNPMFSLEENMTFYANHMLTSFILVVPLNAIDFKDVYKKTTMFEWCNIRDSEAKVVVLQ